MKLKELCHLAGIPTESSLPALQDSNISVTGSEKRRLERELHIQPGTPEWFQLWFSLPYLTGEKPVK
jgi:hypothetical protein